MGLVIAVTGATGNNGRAVAEQLLSRGIVTRAIARGAEKLSPLAAAGAEPWVGDLGNAGFLARAFHNVDAVFAMIPQHFDVADYAADQQRMIDATLDALRVARVRRIVALSTPAARLRTGPPALLGEFEDRLRELPEAAVVVLQPMFYMENHLASLPMILKAGITGGVIRGDTKIPMVATRDVAAAAVRHLLEPATESYAIQPLLGARDYSFREASSIIGSVLGRPELPYVEFPEEQVRQSLQAAGFSASGAEAMLQLGRAYNEERIQRIVERDDGNTTATSLEEFAREVFAPAYHAAGGQPPA